MRAAPMWTLLLAGCGPPGFAELVLHPTPDHADVFADFSRFTGHERLVVEADADPVSAARGRGLHVALVEDLDGCTECYRIEADGRRYVVHADGVLGLQYGAADLLEQMGFRFGHPHRPRAPERFSAVEPAGAVVAPEMERRGLHLHTLHPIEGLYDFWEPSDDGRDRAERTIDWVVKNRGNHLQWVALDDIEKYEGLRAPWAEHTAGLVDYAHARGITTGIGVQLFGTSNLQLAYDLVDVPSDVVSDRPIIAERTSLLLDSADFDVVSLSFGEFSGEDPDTFLAYADVAVEEMRSHPGVDVVSTIHVGNYDDLRIEYRGEELLYYFLAKYTDTRPWVHSVMYYNLFEDAGLAYLHEEFDEHRAFLIERLQAGEPVGYHPESAYWVAFDINVPTYLPLYVRSRFTDLFELQAFGQLQDHVLFSTGWEWGYWQNDVATLRMNHTLPEGERGWTRELLHAYEPWGVEGALLAHALIDLTDVQHTWLLEARLGRYLAGREGIIDLGDALGIVSQPDRVQPHEVPDLDDAGRAALEADVQGLAELAAQTGAIADRVAALGLEGDPWFDEMRDGTRVTALRAAFAHEVYRRALDGGGVGGAEGLLAEAEAVVQRRHADLHWTGGTRLLEGPDSNPTLYQFGYLAKADELCFWRRELEQLRLLLEGAGDVPACV